MRRDVEGPAWRAASIRTQSRREPAYAAVRTRAVRIRLNGGPVRVRERLADSATHPPEQPIMVVEPGTAGSRNVDGESRLRLPVRARQPGCSTPQPGGAHRGRGEALPEGHHAFGRGLRYECTVRAAQW